MLFECSIDYKVGQEGMHGIFVLRKAELDDLKKPKRSKYTWVETPSRATPYLHGTCMEHCQYVEDWKVVTRRAGSQ